MPTIDNQAVGKRIKEIRSTVYETKLTQSEFGNLLDPPVKKSAVRNWEKGDNLPNSERIRQISEIGNVSTDFILFGKHLSGYGERIKDIRTKKLFMTTEEFASTFKNKQAVNKNTVSSWEEENLLPNLYQLERIASLVETSVSDIVWGIQEPEIIVLMRRLESKFDNANLTDTQEQLRFSSAGLILNLRKILVENSDEALFESLSDLLSKHASHLKD